ncbi:hypothetical protein LEP1GSC169_2996 [Leptospira santarosai str. HAI1349]|nr:hypothetical protein LEP1GSC169_2996 [Leptospira santarosai str. HAI1349]EMP79800.1 hypothetical protein LEP1GSC162_1887 [Leptospira santarosai str. CBC1531]
MIAHLKVASRTEESYSFLNPDLRVQIDPSFGVFTIQFDLRKKIYVMNPCAELIFFKSRP